MLTSSCIFRIFLLESLIVMASWGYYCEWFLLTSSEIAYCYFLWNPLLSLHYHIKGSIVQPKIQNHFRTGHVKDNEAKVWQNGHETWKMNPHLALFDAPAWELLCNLNFWAHLCSCTMGYYGASACGGSWLPAPFKIEPWYPGSLNYFLDATQISFQCSIKFFLLSPCSLRNFSVAPYLITSALCSLDFFLCSLLPTPFPTLLPAPWLFWPPFSRLPKTPCRGSSRSPIVKS